MYTPYLIQRGTIQMPYAAADARLSEAVHLDYMGSAEFEFGALPQLLRALQKGTRRIGDVPTILENGAPLKALHIFTSNNDRAQYADYLLEMRGNQIRLKEWSDFDPSSRFRHTKTNFWWDVVNSVMWSFDAHFMGRIEDYLQASFKYMDSK
jgi:hypothetical protein